MIPLNPLNPQRRKMGRAAPGVCLGCEPWQSVSWAKEAWNDGESQWPRRTRLLPENLVILSSHPRDEEYKPPNLKGLTDRGEEGGLCAPSSPP